MSPSVRNEVLAISVVASVGALAAVASGIDPTVRLVLALPLVVFVPGYALIRAAAPAAPLSPVAGFVLALGASMALTVLGGLFLQVTPAGMTSASWADLLFLISMFSAIVLAWRSRHLVPDSGPRGPSVVDLVRSGERRTIAVYGSLFLASAVIVVAAFGVAIYGFDNQPRPGFSQLWILPAGDQATATIGIDNDEGQAIDVALTLTLGSTVEAEWPSINLADGARWQETAVVPGFATGDQPLVATLTRVGFPDSVYRYVTLWPSAQLPTSS